MDATNLNPQNKNAQNIVARWKHSSVTVRTLNYAEPTSAVADNVRVSCQQLWRSRKWLLDLVRQYQRTADAIFYPGIHRFDDLGMSIRRITGRRIPTVCTIEGLLGNVERERQYSKWAGHQVFCQRVDLRTLQRSDRILERADAIIAISPFLEKIASKRFGDKVIVLPLGIDTNHFHARDRVGHGRFAVISAGRVEQHKRPDLFLKLAEDNPDADFKWLGEGSLRQPLLNQAAKANLKNIEFPGPVPPRQLADAMRSADLFVMPSKSEGVPKVTQEAAACGCAQVIFGFYEAPSVVHEENGFVVWDDDEFYRRTSQLIQDRQLNKAFGTAGAELASRWDWDLVAAQWQETICSHLPV